MATKSRTNRNHGHHEAQRPGAEMTDAARKNYEEAIRAGQKFQEEAGAWWERILTQTSSATDWQRDLTHLAAMVGSVMPMAQRCVVGSMEVMKMSGSTSSELVRKAMDAAQTPSLAEGQAKWMEFWTSSLKAAQSNVEAVTQLGTSTIDCWIESVRKNADFTGIRAPRTA